MYCEKRTSNFYTIFYVNFTTGVILVFTVIYPFFLCVMKTTNYASNYFHYVQTLCSKNVNSKRYFIMDRHNFKPT